MPSLGKSGAKTRTSPCVDEETGMHADPRDARSVIEQDAMTWRQMLIVLLCVLLNGLDGFDVLSISFASPGIAAEWGSTGQRWASSFR